MTDHTPSVAVCLLTPDAPSKAGWQPAVEWFRSLLPADAVRNRCCIGLDEEPEHHVDYSWGRWRVWQVASWYEISAARTLVVTPKWGHDPLRHVVATLRVLGALPMPDPTVNVTRAHLQGAR